MINKENTKSTTKTTCQVNTGRGFTSHIYIYMDMLCIFYIPLSLSLSLVVLFLLQPTDLTHASSWTPVSEYIKSSLSGWPFLVSVLALSMIGFFFLLRFPFRLFFTVIVYAHELNTSAYEYMYVCPRFE